MRARKRCARSYLDGQEEEEENDENAMSESVDRDDELMFKSANGARAALPSHLKTQEGNESRGALWLATMQKS